MTQAGALLGTGIGLYIEYFPAIWRRPKGREAIAFSHAIKFLQCVSNQ